MSFQLGEVDLDKDFGEVIRCLWEAHEEPFQPLYRLYCPTFDEDREASIKESTERFLEWHRHDPQSRWLKVTDTSTGKIVGGAWYKIYSENPFLHEEDEVAYWYPDDSTRDYVTQAIEQMDRPRKEKATNPQVFLNILCTHPDYRRKGIGAMLLEWGLEVAKDKNVEFWLNSTPVGKPLYERYGFEVVERNTLVPRTDHPDDNWKKIEKEMEDVVFWTMYMPRKERN
ncbi:acetyltransferas-like protein [Periconia macrospinosa]|uniref:Acetyltransferas-like protein n=1 Tax=Periconia macrospinosa TaxID=97972 RepID=A0A2V1EAQ3_9PLEO|nr:acetyltransferas-like protein [Periconia macrospinosa]